MTYCSKTKLLCDSLRGANNLKNIIGINATIINTSKITDVTNCGICNFLCEGICIRSHEFLSIISLCKKTSSNITFFCPNGKVYICAPIIYDNEIAALFLAGPIDIREERIGFDMKNIWQLSSFLEVFSKGLNSEKEALWARVDYFELLQNTLLMDLRLNNVSDFKTKINELLFDSSLRIPECPFSSKALALNIFILFSKIALDNKLDLRNLFGKNYELFSKLKTAKYESEIEDLLKQISVNFTNTIFGKASPRHLAISDAISYIEKHYSEKLSLELVASKIFMSPHYLSKAFSVETGTRFCDFLNKTRIEKAKILLENDKLELKEVARAVGFEDQSYFSKVFKKITGISPKQYKIRTTLNL